jgi:hypothetical protein
MGKGKGKGKSNGFSLPDIIKKQGALSEKMKEGSKKGKKPGAKGTTGKSGKNGKSGKEGSDGKNGKSGKNGKPGEKGKGGKEGEGENEDLDGELYKIYKEQSMLRQQLQDAIQESENDTPGGNAAFKKVLKTMEQLENEILEKGFNAATYQKMQELNYELLKLDKAALEQGEEKKRKANSNLERFRAKQIKELQFKKLFYNQTEILNRQSLPLHQSFKKKVRDYFSDPEKKL